MSDVTLLLDEALTRLAAARPQAAELVNLRLFAGLTLEEIAPSLDRSCGDNRALRTEVEALLRAQERSSDLLDLPEDESCTADLPADEGRGMVIGPYKLLEPCISRTSGAELVHGLIAADKPLEIVSRMAQNGVIFGDGVGEDRLDFDSGAIARIGLVDRTLRLVVPEGAEP